MQCPNCKYVHGGYWEEEEYYNRDGEYGEFYQLPIKMEIDEYSCTERKRILGCPKCRILFMEG
jgi:hypothetical protein